MNLTAKLESDRIGKALALGLRPGRCCNCFFADRIEKRSFTMTISSWLSGHFFVQPCPARQAS